MFVSEASLSKSNLNQNHQTSAQLSPGLFILFYLITLHCNDGGGALDQLTVMILLARFPGVLLYFLK